MLKERQSQQNWFCRFCFFLLRPQLGSRICCAFKTVLVITRLSQALRKSATQWTDQIKLYLSTALQSPRVYRAFLCCFLHNWNTQNLPAFPSGTKSFLRVRTLRAQIQAAAKIGPGNENVDFHHTLLYCCLVYLFLSPLELRWNQIRVQLCLRSLIWALIKEGCGSAGCPPAEGRTLASSTSPLKVRESYFVTDIAYYSNKDLTCVRETLSTQSLRCPLLLPNCLKRGVSSCWWCQWSPTAEMAPLFPSSSSTSLWRTARLGHPS